MNRAVIRKTVERFPWLANAYRDMRDRRQRKHLTVHTTPYGFSILGGSYLAADAQEDTEIGLLLSRLEDFDVLIDVGANSGVYTCLAGSRGKHVISIEPSQDNLSILIDNLRINNLADQVEVFPVAVADRVGTLPLYGRGQGASLIRGWGDQQHRARVVPVNTIDNIVGNRFCGERLFLKMDVEGAELRALSGARNTLTKCSQALIEISLTRNHPRGENHAFAQTFQLFWDLGYKAYSIGSTLNLITPDSLQVWIKEGRADQNTENFWFAKSAEFRTVEIGKSQSTR